MEGNEILCLGNVSFIEYLGYFIMEQSPTECMFFIIVIILPASTRTTYSSEHTKIMPLTPSKKDDYTIQ